MAEASHSPLVDLVDASDVQNRHSVTAPANHSLPTYSPRIVAVMDAKESIA